MDKLKLNCYTDGSFNETTKQASWAFVIIKEDQVIHKNKGIILDENWNSGRQIAGECWAVVNALEWAKQNNYKLDIFFDYAGLKSWIADIWNEKPWKTNKEYTVLYRQKVLELSDHLNTMVKIKGHSGNKWNDFVDSYAKTY